MSRGNVAAGWARRRQRLNGPLTYCRDPERAKPLLFCQIEAIETAIYIAEVVSKYSGAWIENDLRSVNDDSGTPTPRLEDGDGLGQDGDHGDVDRMAGVEQI